MLPFATFTSPPPPIRPYRSPMLRFKTYPSPPLQSDVIVHPCRDSGFTRHRRPPDAAVHKLHATPPSNHMLPFTMLRFKIHPSRPSNQMLPFTTYSTRQLPLQSGVAAISHGSGIARAERASAGSSSSQFRSEHPTRQVGRSSLIFFFFFFLTHFARYCF